MISFAWENKENENLTKLINVHFSSVVVQEVPKTISSFNDSLERLLRLSKAVYSKLWLITVKEYRLKSATGKVRHGAGARRDKA